MYYHHMKQNHVANDRRKRILDERKYTLKELRARKDVTQEQAAKALGVSAQTYNAWEKDISNVSVSKVLKVANYYGVNISNIFLPTT